MAHRHNLSLWAQFGGSDFGDLDEADDPSLKHVATAATMLSQSSETGNFQKRPDVPVRRKEKEENARSADQEHATRSRLSSRSPSSGRKNTSVPGDFKGNHSQERFMGASATEAASAPAFPDFFDSGSIEERAPVFGADVGLRHAAALLRAGAGEAEWTCTYDSEGVISDDDDSTGGFGSEVTSSPCLSLTSENLRIHTAALAALQGRGQLPELHPYHPSKADGGRCSGGGGAAAANAAGGGSAAVARLAMELQTASARWERYVRACNRAVPAQDRLAVAGAGAAVAAASALLALTICLLLPLLPSQPLLLLGLIPSVVACFCACATFVAARAGIRAASAIKASFGGGGGGGALRGATDTVAGPGTVVPGTAVEAAAMLAPFSRWVPLDMMALALLSVSLLLHIVIATSCAGGGVPPFGPHGCVAGPAIEAGVSALETAGISALLMKVVLLRSLEAAAGVGLPFSKEEMAV